LRQIGSGLKPSRRWIWASIRKDDALDSGGENPLNPRRNHYFPAYQPRKKKRKLQRKKAPVIDLKPEIDYEEFSKVRFTCGENSGGRGCFPKIQ